MSSASEFSFARCYRLTKTDEYSSVFGFRRAIKSTHFLLHYRPRAKDVDASGPEQAGRARLGIVVPKKLLKTAVRRNLVKRLAREQFRHLLQLPAMDLVLRLVVRPVQLERKTLAKEICELFLKLNAPKR